MRLFLLLLLFLQIFSFTFSQSWEYNIDKDYVYKLRDKWGDSQKYIAKFTVSNDSITYFKQAKGEKDNWIQVAFPDDFTLIKGLNNKSYPQVLTVKGEVLREVIFIDTINYYPGPKGFLQLTPFNSSDQKHNNYINETIIDSYKWEDSLGTNYFYRTKNKTKNATHIYFYHFIKLKDLVLIRKHVDFVKNCNDLFNTDHLLESIQITDLNEDYIAEITCTYTVGCLERQKKILLFTEGKKYFLRGSGDTRNSYKISGELKKEPEFLRFLQKKWENEASEK